MSTNLKPHQVPGDSKVGWLKKKENPRLARCSTKHPRLLRLRQPDSVLLLNQVEKQLSDLYLHTLESVAQWWGLAGTEALGSFLAVGNKKKHKQF